MIFRCALLILLLTPFLSISQEICDNGVDDDNDGQIDLNDSDCLCLDILDDILYLPNGDFQSSPSCCPENNFSKDDCLDNWIPVNGSPEHIDPDCYPDLSEEETIGIPIESEIIGLKYNDFSSFVFKETFGTCTNVQLDAGIKYRLAFDIRFTPKDEHNSGVGNPKLVFYGLKDCSELIFTDATEGDLCDLNFDLYPLDSLSFDDISYTEWQTVNKTFAPPENINAIIVGFDCRASVYSLKRFMFLDNIKISRLLNQQFDFDLSIEPDGDPCDDNFLLSTMSVSGFDYQWYNDGVAILGENDNSYSVTDNDTGIFQLALANPDGCVVLNPVDLNSDESRIDTTICFGTALDLSTGSYDEAGTYTEKLSSDFSCKTFIYELDIADIIAGETVVASFQKGSVYSFAGEQYDTTGTFEVVLQTAKGCDSLVTLVLSELDFTINVPNVFDSSLSGNDRLTVYIDPSSVEVVNEFSVYDRWGNLIFNKKNLPPNEPDLGWDGRINNKSVNPGAYIVYIQATFNDGAVKEQWTTVHVIK